MVCVWCADEASQYAVLLGGVGVKGCVVFGGCRVVCVYVCGVLERSVCVCEYMRNSERGRRESE